MLQYNIGPELLASEDLIRIVRESGADIIALQEVAGAQAEELLNGVEDVYPYQIYELEGGTAESISDAGPSTPESGRAVVSAS